ncbi:hypothetical protein [Sandarakinorhabdus cyanobacteriorum]|uniref:hypothetical protein n=1 Tax=Sandarakinorhabdus cyanobacteriorum TaxID=1981098 RepID=UPI001056C22A|nr:hypothetical protein [Sandarakinorhabdus cyanobacteriorum]
MLPGRRDRGIGPWTPRPIAQSPSQSALEEVSVMNANKASNAASTQKNYLLVEGNTFHAVNAYFMSCAKLRKPMLVVRSEKRYWKVEWDCIIQDHEKFRIRLEDSQDEILDSMIEKINSISDSERKRLNWHVKLDVGYVSGISKSAAEKLAKEYFDILNPVFA